MTEAWMSPWRDVPQPVYVPSLYFAAGGAGAATAGSGSFCSLTAGPLTGSAGTGTGGGSDAAGSEAADGAGVTAARAERGDDAAGAVPAAARLRVTGSAGLDG